MSKEHVNKHLIAAGNDLFKLTIAARYRGLRHVGLWATELRDALCEMKGLEECLTPDLSELEVLFKAPEYNRYEKAKCYFDNREYDRAAHFTEGCTNPIVKFLHFYSLYCSAEKRRLDDIADGKSPAERSKKSVLKVLRKKLQNAYIAGTLDGYCIYLYGMVLKKLIGPVKTTIEMMCEAVNTEPLNWGAWLELAMMIQDRKSLRNLELPSYWMKKFFMAHAYLELQINELALESYHQLMEAGFFKSSHILSQLALTYKNLDDYDKSIEYFQKVLKSDPYRLDNIDIYSNILYIKELRVELSHLAHNTFNIDRYRAETCCTIANFFSLRCNHEKALLYYNRAQKLDPNYFSAYTFMGHEYMHMRNTYGAIKAYRQAVEVNFRDYRAWIGLGHSYKVLHMISHSLCYYKQAHFLKPNDSRMITSVGECYESMNLLEDAKKWYWRSHVVGDAEGQGIFKLAQLCDTLAEESQAASAYDLYIQNAVTNGPSDPDELCLAYICVCRYYMKNGNFDKAFNYAQTSLKFAQTKEEAKSILQEIARNRVTHEEEMEESVGDTTEDSSMNLS